LIGSLNTVNLWSLSTRTIAFCPPSVTQAARSGPTITPCGAEPGPRVDQSVGAVAWIEPAELAVAWQLNHIVTPSLQAVTIARAARFRHRKILHAKTVLLCGGVAQQGRGRKQPGGGGEEATAIHGDPHGVAEVCAIIAGGGAGVRSGWHSHCLACMTRANEA
jgi:hypothetical protein